MKGKIKTQKGITLIALIITIVVLLILAVVAINSIQNDGIISKAEQATNKYNQSVQNEQSILNSYLEKLEQSVNKPHATQLWDADWTYGKSIANGGGTIFTYNNGSLSSPVELDYNKTYVLRCEFDIEAFPLRVLRIAYYDSNNAYITDTVFEDSFRDTFVFTVPGDTNISLARFTFKKANGTEKELVPTKTTLYDVAELNYNGFKLAGKTILNFGDSIAIGYSYSCRSYVYQIAFANYINVYNEAVAGATIRVKDKLINILSQITSSTITDPDFILINGLTNDAYSEVTSDPSQLGAISESVTSTLDTSTFCGSFETTLKTAKEKWPTAKIIYVTTHKNASRGLEPQNILTELAIDMCEKWNVTVADIYHDSGFDTFDDNQFSKYINDGSHPNTLGYKTYYVPIIEAKLNELS